MADSDDVIRRIDRMRFTPVRLREGYDMGEVDDLLDRLVQAAREGHAFAPIVAGAKFTPVRMREGYDMGEVDAFLAKMAGLTPVAGESAAREAAASPTARELVARIRDSKFRTSTFREGYPITEVDELFDELVRAALEERSLLPLIDSATFSRKKFQQVYRPEDVDQALRNLAGR
ncbi:DivIVA domain-containing protein [Nocardioides marmorisolisilvae]|uniref:DivIVA domain-containing protein n=1 Tax=Nocardioides marmorisolisilvae TaxID=1542737 RepID=A0A3N0DVA8_9ACTN|nr:DivIVA domain-containing protein [Nocardioides marmorisolisilvae]RNL79557.1 DivIVA domain-containing protein [Nocardioides marmorisolisilvae]